MSNSQRARDQQTLSPEGAHYLASQAFFFLKDITHRHQHHEPARDTIVDLYHWINNDETCWQRATYYSLIRSIIAQKRQKLGPTVGSALGILAYAGSFKRLVHDQACGEDFRLPEYNHDSLRASLEAQQNVLTNKDMSKNNSIMKWQNFLVMMIAVLATVFGAANMSDLRIAKGETHSWIVSIVEWFVIYPLLTLSTMVLVVTSVAIILIACGLLPMPRFFQNVNHALAALLVTLPRKLAGFLAICIGTIGIAALIYAVPWFASFFL
jgi:hypothetical protein